MSRRKKTGEVFDAEKGSPFASRWERVPLAEDVLARIREAGNLPSSDPMYGHRVGGQQFAWKAAVQARARAFLADEFGEVEVVVERNRSNSTLNWAVMRRTYLR